MSKKKIPIIAGVVSVLIWAAPAQANNPFSGVVNGLLGSVTNTGKGILRGTLSNPVGTFEILLNNNVIKLKGQDLKRVRKGLELYNKYGKYFPVIGNQPIPPNLLIDQGLQAVGVDTGLPTSLQDIIDLATGKPKRNQSAANADDYSCLSFRPGGCKYTELYEQLKGEAILAQQGPLGRINPASLRKFNREAALRGISPDRLINNPIPASIYTSNTQDRQLAEAEVEAVLSEEGQQQAADRIEAVYGGLQGINETAQAGAERPVSQDKLQAIMLILAQMSGFEAIKITNQETANMTEAMRLQVDANTSRTMDAIERRKTFNSALDILQNLKKSRGRRL